MAIVSFSGSRYFLSNFYPVPEGVSYGGRVYRCVEGAYQAAKTTNPVLRQRFRNMTGAEAKRAGKAIVLRSDWEAIKLEVMECVLRSKFIASALTGDLMATGNEELIEGNYWHDTFWGVCNCKKCGGVGENNLGRLLMKIREEIKQTR